LVAAGQRDRTAGRVYEQWGVSPGGWSCDARLLDHLMLISASLVKVAVGIANFSGPNPIR
jgi:hypothetical protein